MKKVVILILLAIIIACTIVSNVNLSNYKLTIGGFYLSLIGLIISVGGTFLSGLSFVNAKAAKNAATEAREQFAKGQQNIELSQLYKQGTEVREKAQKLLDKGSENHEEILKEIERFAYKAEDLIHLISVDRARFSNRASLIHYKVHDFRRGIKTPGIYNNQDSIVSQINDKITKVLQISSEQMSENIK